MNIAGIEIGHDQPCRFVAELSNNWRVRSGENETDTQRRDRTGRLIDAAKAAGADFVKLQCYSPSELIALRGDGPAPEPWGSQGYTMGSLYELARTPFDWFPKIKAHCERVGMPWFSSVFGAESLAVLESLECPAYKIARLDNQQDVLVDAAAATGRPLIVSSNTTARADALTLYCPEGYPQTQMEFRREWFVEAVTDTGDYPPYFDGFSFHGTDPLPCVVAATLGAKIIEAHIQLDDEPSELESAVSLTASEFRRMVDTVRRVEAMLG